MERSNPRESESCREIPIEVLPEILLRLPTKDIIRSSCVSKLWHSVAGDPSFRKLHAADHLAAPSESEALLVSENREPGRRDEASVFNLSSGKAMCHVAIPSGYGLANICNGFLCFALNDDNGYGYDQAPALVCNPITGETLELPEAPAISVPSGVIYLSHRFILGFSPSTKEYKMFRLSFPRDYKQGLKINYIAVYTLGGNGGWRQYSYLSQFCPSHTLLAPEPTPLHIDGDLYVPVETGPIYTLDGVCERGARMLVLNVATERCCTYLLPYNYDVGYHPAWKDMLAYGFELNGQMCLAVNVLCPRRRRLQFWVMTPPGELEYKDDRKLYWDMRYSFEMGDEPCYVFRPRGAWLDHAKMLCYRHGDSLYKHDTEGHSSSSDHGFRLFDEQLELPEAPSKPSCSCRWNIYGGYRPSFLSPLTFALPPSQGEKGKKRQFEHTLIHAVKQSKCRNERTRVNQHQ